MKFNSIITIALLLLLQTFCYSQDVQLDKNAYKYEIEIGTDNDNFIVYTATDRNYTYGINAGLRWVPKHTLFEGIFKNAQKHYQRIGFNIEGYTPNYQDESEPENTGIERPFAGWSYVNFETAYTFETSFLALRLDLGILGPSSQVDAIQNWVHENITGDSSVDWTGQIPNQLGINIRGIYARELYSTGWFDTYFNTNASLGNIFTYLHPSLQFRVGKFNNITESIALHNRLLTPPDKAEFFIEYGLGYKFSGYNGTVQGDLFGNDMFGDDGINHNIFTMNLSLNVAFERWAATIAYNYGTGEFENTQIHRYGSLRLFYKFK